MSPAPCCPLTAALVITAAVVVVVVVAGDTNPGPPETDQCCHHIEDGQNACYSACQKVTMETGTQQQLHELAEVARACPQHLVLFWQCVNNTFAAVSSADVWSGLSCCGLPLVHQCQNSCRRARSIEDVGSSCLPTQELAFFSCLERQEVGDRCCGGPVSAQCLATCKGIFLEDTVPSMSTLSMLGDHCNDHVTECVQNYTMILPTLNPQQSLLCCEQADNMVCRTGCRDILMTLTEETQIVEQLCGVCGQPSFTDSMWQCFLIQSTRGRLKPPTGGIIETAGIDGAKLACCTKAHTESCRNLCVKTYSRGWTQSWTQFDRKCVTDPLESDLNLCLNDVDERCQLGCTGLNYCSNFNGRPTELFRSCSSAADKAAWSDVRLWQTGFIDLPQGTRIPIRSILTCQPGMWQAIACTLQIKPCHRHKHTTQICRSDCVDILTECVDWSRLESDHTADSLCTMLNAQDDRSQCIPLHHYLQPGPSHATQQEVTSPCRLNPCDHDEVCIINRRKCKHSHNCRAHKCQAACRLGEVSQYLVPQHSYVSLPRSSKLHAVCYKVCRCGHHGMLTHCANTDCTKPCHMDTGRIAEHGTTFRMGCQWCACHAGVTICDTRPCLPPRASAAQRAGFTGLPCGCGRHYMPVCATNGKTYPTACLARCVGLSNSQFKAGACEAQDPCDPNPCHPGHKCIIKRCVCLTLTPKCHQFVCVSIMQGDCEHHRRSPVCDTTGEEFSNLCLLHMNKRKLAHHGHCFTGCRRAGVVCGHNGATYRSECAAWAAGTSRDYFGHCRTVGYLKDGSENPTCDEVTCPSGPSVPCHTITPPGACCPICGGEIRALYSPDAVSRTEAAGKMSRMLTVDHVLHVLLQHLSVIECGVFSYLSIERDLVILLMPIVATPTKLQYEACVMEAERLGILLASQSPIILSHIPMHAVTAAHTRIAIVGVASSAPAPLPSSHLVKWTLLLLLLPTFILTWNTRR